MVDQNAARELLVGQQALMKRVQLSVQQGVQPQISKAEVRQLLLELQNKNPPLYEQVKGLKLKDQRKLFLEPILNALGLGSIASSLGPLGTSLMGIGAVGAGVAIGAIAGRMAQSKAISELKRDQMKIGSEMMMVKNQRDNERAKLEYKLGELENQLSDLSETSESGVNLLNLWVDSHTLI